MTRISVDDGQGGKTGMWFDDEASACCSWTERTDWNGNNHISVNTGSQWSHERLYRTAKGAWVLNSYSAWEGSRDTYEQIDPKAAAAWLVANGHQDAADKYFPAEVAAAEL